MGRLGRMTFGLDMSALSREATLFFATHRDRDHLVVLVVNPNYERYAEIQILSTYLLSKTLQISVLCRYTFQVAI